MSTPSPFIIFINFLIMSYISIRLDCFFKKTSVYIPYFNKVILVVNRNSSPIGEPGFSRWHQWERTCLQMQEMQVQSLGWEDPLEEEMATHRSILA